MYGRNKTAAARAIFSALSLILLVALMITCTFMRSGSWFGGTEADKRPDNLSEPSDGLRDPDMLAGDYSVTKITFSGSVTPASMLGSESFGTFNSAFKEASARDFLASLSDIFENDRVTIAGCNATLSDSEEIKPQENADSEWYLGKKTAAKLFSEGGIEAVSLECSRIFDYGDAGYSDTKLALDEAGVQWHDRQKPLVLTVDGDITFFCGFYRMSECELEGAENEVLAEIKNASENHEFVALYVTDIHEGVQPCEKKERLFKLFIDSGADLVIGSNSINLQKAEEYGNGLIVYSLGALLDGATKYPERFTSVLSLTLKTDGGEYIGAEYDIIPCTAYSESKPWHPEIIIDKHLTSEVLALTELLHGEIN